MFDLIDKLEDKETLEREEWITLLSAYQDDALRDYAAQKARAVAQSVYGHEVYVRGLIEFTNYCRNDCYYCGIRRSNPDADRYRLTKEDIFACCEEGWKLGFRTFVLQGGEDGYFRDEWYEELIHEIKQRYPKCAVTLSVGERSGETYRRWYEAGQTVICCAMRRRTMCITVPCIRRKCRRSIGRNVCIRCVRSVIRWAVALW